LRYRRKSGGYLFTGQQKSVSLPVFPGKAPDFSLGQTDDRRNVGNRHSRFQLISGDFNPTFRPAFLQAFLQTFFQTFRQAFSSCAAHPRNFITPGLFPRFIHAFQESRSRRGHSGIFTFECGGFRSMKGEVSDHKKIFDEAGQSDEN
jgi:hypothetical protein